MRMSNTNRAIIALVAFGILIGAFALLNGSGGDDGSGASGTVQTGTGPTGGATAPENSVTVTKTVTATVSPAPKEIQVENGKPVGGVAKLSVSKGERVRFTVTSDVSDEIHVHGYDLSKDVGPGKPAAFSFEATIEGRFEVELEQRGEQIARLEVTP